MGCQSGGYWWVSLETSLVEWKRTPYAHPYDTGMYLGNFLSGMETCPKPRKSPPRRCLGNFLSGMETQSPHGRAEPHQPLETSLVEWKLPLRRGGGRGRRYLGNFLSGMETPRHHVAEMLQLLLGNFLSGMETLALLASGQITAFTLETSLVEWKHAHLALDVDKKYPLETSLVEWKLLRRSERYSAWLYLGNFLSGMETLLRRYSPFLTVHLGNFLSGMETSPARTGRRRDDFPWKLP